MEWKALKTEEDIADLLKTFMGFHDGVLKEIHLWNGYFVSEELRMGSGNGVLNATVLFQREWKNPSAIEIQFDDVQRMNIVGIQPNEWYMIFDSTLFCRDGLFYWADIDGWKASNPDSERTTWIAAKGIKWRDRSEWMGEDLRYGAKDVEP